MFVLMASTVHNLWPAQGSRLAGYRRSGAARERTDSLSLELGLELGVGIGLGGVDVVVAA